EADEPDRVGVGRRRRRDLRRERHGGRVRPAAGPDQDGGSELRGGDVVLRKILIANRGEIALRVARACRELGIPSVAIYSTADSASAVVRYADEAIQVGPAPARQSYLNVPNVIEAA